MLCYVVLCYAMLCYAMLCYAMLCYVCYAMLCYAMLCYDAMLCYTAMLYCTVLCYAMLYYAMPCHATPCYAMLWASYIYIFVNINFSSYSNFDGNKQLSLTNSEQAETDEEPGTLIIYFRYNKQSIMFPLCGNLKLVF